MSNVPQAIWTQTMYISHLPGESALSKQLSALLRLAINHPACTYFTSKYEGCVPWVKFELGQTSITRSMDMHLRPHSPRGLFLWKFYIVLQFSITLQMPRGVGYVCRVRAGKGNADFALIIWPIKIMRDPLYCHLYLVYLIFNHFISMCFFNFKYQMTILVTYANL